MKVVQISTDNGIGSIGRICVAVSKLLNESGIENYILYSHGSTGYEKGIKFGLGKRYYKFQALYSRLYANNGFNSYLATKKLIENLDKIKPDIIHLHNIHSHAVNLTMLFNYLRKHKVKTYWTFHDEWAFTAYCPFFVTANCYKWKTGCYKCPQLKGNSFFLDRSKSMWKKKKNIIRDIDLTIITPSQWMAELVKESFFKKYPVKVINNGIDLSIFKKKESDFKKRHNIEDKFMVLGVAFKWQYFKGLDVIKELSKTLGDNYKIVLVGTDSQVDSELPDNIISVHRTNSQEELAEIYSAADVFVNPTREENYPTVHMEAIACGTPVVTFDTGGCKEMLSDKTGIVVDVNDTEAMRKAIVNVCENGALADISSVDVSSDFDMNNKYKEYLELYTENK